MDHKTKRVNINGELVDIDNNIVELVLLLNNHTDLKTQYSCENLNESGRIQIMLRPSVTDRQVYDFFKEHSWLLKHCEIVKRLKRYDRNNNLVMQWIMYIDLSNYNLLLDRMYIALTDKIFYYNAFVYDYSENPIETKMVIGLGLDYEQKEYNREELLNDIIYKLDLQGYKDKIWIVKMNKLYYVRFNDKWFNSSTLKNMTEFIKDNRKIYLKVIK